MPFTILLTGFGPFPGAPTNPTGPLVVEATLVDRGVIKTLTEPAPSGPATVIWEWSR